MIRYLLFASLVFWLSSNQLCIAAEISDVVKSVSLENSRHSRIKEVKIEWSKDGDPDWQPNCKLIISNERDTDDPDVVVDLRWEPELILAGGGKNLLGEVVDDDVGKVVTWSSTFLCHTDSYGQVFVSYEGSIVSVAELIARFNR